MATPATDCTAEEFIAAYYQSLVYKTQDIPKFYDPDNAIIWRKSVDSRLGVKFSEAIAKDKDILVPHIERGSTVSVLEFQVMPNDRGFVLNVIGKIARGATSTLFNQVFTICRREDRVFIVGDSLNFLNGFLGGKDEDFNIVYVPPKGKNNRKKQGQGHGPESPPAGGQEARPAQGQKGPQQQRQRRQKGNGQFNGQQKGEQDSKWSYSPGDDASKH
jgi:hypothetical protein